MGEHDRFEDEGGTGLGTSLELQPDPEALFIFAAWMSHLGEYDRALLALTRAVRGGFFAADTLARQPVFEPLRGFASSTRDSSFRRCRPTRKSSPCRGRSAPTSWWMR